MFKGAKSVDLNFRSGPWRSNKLLGSSRIFTQLPWSRPSLPCKSSQRCRSHDLSCHAHLIVRDSHGIPTWLLSESLHNHYKPLLDGIITIAGNWECPALPAVPAVLLRRGQRHLYWRQHGERGQVWTKGCGLFHLGCMAIMAITKIWGRSVHWASRRGRRYQHDPSIRWQQPAQEKLWNCIKQWSVRRCFKKKTLYYM